MAGGSDSHQNEALAHLTAQPLRALKQAWRSPAQAELLAEARRIEASEGIDGYWAWAASHLRWIRHWDSLRSGGFGDLAYYCGGRLNIADNCIDRHAEDPTRANRRAIIWEGEDGEIRTWSYRKLREEVARLANGLLCLGIRQGDVVAIYMPNLSEAVAAVHACNRIGAIHTILFAGFSPDAIA